MWQDFPAMHPTAWTRLGSVLTPSEPWEGEYLQNFTCVAKPLEAEHWRLWYSVNDTRLPYAIALAEGVPGESMRKSQAILAPGKLDPQAPLGIGNMPKEWFPVQPVELELPSGRRRLYFWAHGPGVVRYLAADSEDGRHFYVLDPHRPCLYHPNDRAAVTSKSSQILGLTPSQSGFHQRPDAEPIAPDHLICNDATNVYLLPDKTYECYTVALFCIDKSDSRYVAHDNAAGWVRVIDRLKSEDGLHWEQRERIIEPDANDPTDLQFYYLSAVHSSGGRLGLLGHYRVQAQTMDWEWCVSRDGSAWDRTRRGFWLDTVRPDMNDCLGVYAPHAPVLHEGKIWLFYTGVNYTHNHKHHNGSPRSVVMLATTEACNFFDFQDAV